MYAEMDILPFWWNFHHWLQRKLSKWQLPVPVMKISSKWWHCRFIIPACHDCRHMSMKIKLQLFLINHQQYDPHLTSFLYLIPYDINCLSWPGGNDANYTVSEGIDYHNPHINWTDCVPICRILKCSKHDGFLFQLKIVHSGHWYLHDIS